MVCLTPDPVKEEPPVSPNENVGAIHISDSDEEEFNNYDGYEMLPAENIEYDESEDENPEIILSDPADPVPTPSTFDNSTNAELQTLWKDSAPVNEEMDQAKNDEVLQAMKGFSLPTSAIPPWAQNVGEEDWKRHLLEKIRGKMENN